MTKLGYAPLYSIAATIICLFLVYIGRDTDEKGSALRRQLKLTFLMDGIYFLSFFFNDTRILAGLFALMRIVEVWAIYFVLKFEAEFAEVPFEKNKGMENLLIGGMILDNLITVVNTVTNWFYAFEFRTFGRDVYLVPEMSFWFGVHIAVFACLAVLLGALLFQKIEKLSCLYRKRSTAIFAGYVVGVVLCLLVGSRLGFMEYPIVLFLNIGAVALFFLYFYMPKLRVDEMKGFIIENVTLPIMLFDFEDKLQVVSRLAVEEFQVEKGMALEAYIAQNNLRYILTKERRKAGKTKEFTLTVEYGEKTYLIYGQELWSREKYFIGTLLVYNDISNQERLKDEATYHATRDTLTGLWNREYFFEIVNRTLRENPSIEFVMIVSDIYHFKMFNDILGKKMGDDLLISIARGFQERNLPLWTLSRIAGDRFAMLMPLEDFNEARFVHVTQGIIDQREYALTVRFYLGVYVINNRNINAAAMYDRAYMALESIKGREKTVAYYDEEIRKKRLHDTLNVGELERALREEQFVIYLQPQINTLTKKIVGTEALVRWINPKRGIIPPAEFIPAFEENGMIAEIDYYVWEAACRQLRKWKDEGKTEFSISVNISAKDFYLSDIYASITGLIEKYDVSPENLKLEITETALVLNLEEQMYLVKRLQERGFVVEIDDFGSGYSSLNSLKNIKVDVLKLDMKFFEHSDESGRAEKIIESVIQLAHKLKMAVIAEGVGEKEQVEMLQRIGCHIVQGFYYAMPMPVDEFEEFAKMYPCEKLQDMIAQIKKEKD